MCKPEEREEAEGPTIKALVVPAMVVNKPNAANLQPPYFEVDGVLLIVTAVVEEEVEERMDRVEGLKGGFKC
jgi:hypothetical protein